MNENNLCITTSSPVIGNNNASSLLCVERKQWDTEVIGDIFNERDQQCILATKLEEGVSQDTVQQLEHTGVYSVKSAYKFLQTNKGTWNNQNRDSLWKLLWRVKAPQRL